MASPQQTPAGSAADDEALSRISTPSPRLRGDDMPSTPSQLPGGYPSTTPLLLTDTPSPPKRRRLRGKTPVNVISKPAAAEIWDMVERKWSGHDGKTIDTRIKTWAASHFVRLANQHMQISGACYADRKSLFQSVFYSISDTKLAHPFLRWQWWRVIRLVASDYCGPEPEDVVFTDAQKSKVEAFMRTGVFYSTVIVHGALLTYNDDYCQNVPLVAELVRKHECNPDKAVAAIRNIEEVTALWEEMVRHATDVVRSCGYANQSVAMELSLHAENAGRVHFHVYVSMHQRASVGVTWELLSKQFAFKGKKPAHCSVTMKPRGRRSIESIVQQAHYYCQAPKRGQLFSTGTIKPFQDFPVTAKMVAELWKAHKMTTNAAMKEVLKTRGNVPRWFTEMLRTHNKESDASMQDAVEQALVQHTMKSFKPATPRESSFLKQFVHLPLSKIPGQPGLLPLFSLPQSRRFSFMVYDGRSRTGKTERAAAWWGDAATLVVNAQGTSTPSLRDYDAGKHKAIVYDEGSWVLPASQRMLFQSGLRAVKMAQSNCNSECYDILLYGVPQIITSNNFWAGWDRNNDEHREAGGWLGANMFYQVWNEPCWEESEEEDAEPTLPQL